MIFQDVDGAGLLLVEAVLVPQLDLGPLVHEDETKLDASEVLDSHDHVVEDGHVLAVEAEEAFERDERTDGGQDGEEVLVRLPAPELGHESGDERRQRLREANVASVPDVVAEPHGLALLLQPDDAASWNRNEAFVGPALKLFLGSII